MWQLRWQRIPLQCRRPWFSSWVRKICWRRDRLSTPVSLGFPCGSAAKESPCNSGDPGSIPGSGRSAGKKDRLPTPVFLGFPGGSAGKESACNAGHLRSIPGMVRSPGDGNSYSLHYSGLENSMTCIVHGTLRIRHD